MRTIHLRIADLRKKEGVSQQVLADALGVAFQTVSKWETNATMPDIGLLPAIADYFQVSTDQLLGLKPLPNEEYVPVLSGTKGYWEERVEYLKRTREYMWNQDYMEFLVEKVWKIASPVDILDCGCGYGFLASYLLPLLPHGSTYTGIDLSESLIEEGRTIHQGEHIMFQCADIMEYQARNKFDVVIGQAVLRHIGKPEQFLVKMIEMCKKDGLVICIDVNREVESSGLYIDGMDFGYLCSRPGFDVMWKMELEKQDRDYAIGIRLPDMMTKAGLREVECRVNDKVNYIHPKKEEYQTSLSDLVTTRGWNEDPDEQAVVEGFMNHGMTRLEAEEYCRKQRKIKEHISRNQEQVSVTEVRGLLITYGRKR